MYITTFSKLLRALFFRKSRTRELPAVIKNGPLSIPMHPSNKRLHGGNINDIKALEFSSHELKPGLTKDIAG